MASASASPLVHAPPWGTVLITRAAGFAAAERDLITKAIAQHRNHHDQEEHRSPLSKALRKADGMARLCFSCAALKECRRLDKRPHTAGLIY